MQELDLIKLGFECVEQYTHDEYYTNRYVRGVLEVEFTYRGVLGMKGKLQTVDLAVQEVNCMPITLEKLKMLDAILN